MNSDTTVVVSVGGQLLVLDIADGCKVYRAKGGAPARVFNPTRGSSIPRTRGQIEDSVADELIGLGLIEPDCTLTDAGGEYCRQHRMRR